MSKRVTIAIDGPAGSGKSTLARRLADKLGYLYIDSGAMYRAVALWALRRGIELSDMHRLEQLAHGAQIRFVPGASTVLLNDEDVTEAIRAPGIAEAASKVAAVPAVRRALVEQQRRMGSATSVVMEGRDIGSVVFPDAEVKIFLDAEPLERVHRRALQTDQPPGSVLAEIGQRDQRDRTRLESPLVQAPDAIYFDTTGLSIAEVEAGLLKIIRSRISNGKEAGLAFQPEVKK